jgi:hypothetical protein
MTRSASGGLVFRPTSRAAPRYDSQVSNCQRNATEERWACERREVETGCYGESLLGIGSATRRSLSLLKLAKPRFANKRCTLARTDDLAKSAGLVAFKNSDDESSLESQSTQHNGVMGAVMP